MAFLDEIAPRVGDAPPATPPGGGAIETIIDQLAARGVIEPGALYEPPFTSIHAGGPDALFSGKTQVIDGIFERVERFEKTLSEAG